MNFNQIVVNESPGLCRCCLSEGCYKDLGTEYTWMNETEVYAEMLLDCFDIGITQHKDGPNGLKRLICELCITRLRDACNFKKQVVDAEKRFIDMLGRGELRPKVVVYQPTEHLKVETEDTEEDAENQDIEYLEDDDFSRDEEQTKSEGVQSTSQPPASEETEKRKRGRPRKYDTTRHKKPKPTKGIFFCQHCNALIDSRNHKCCRGKERNYQNDEEQMLNYEECEIQTSLSPGYVANIESDEDANHSADMKTESNAKKNAEWTKTATMAMLSLYEANIQILKDMGKKSKVWEKISEGLKDLSIQVTADQVKWKFNRLNNKYKECIDNNSKSGKAYMTFDYYEQFEQIFHKEKNFSNPRAFSLSMRSTDENKRKLDVSGSSDIIESKKFKIDATSSEENVDESPQLKTPVADVKKTARNEQSIQNMELLENIQENQKARDEKMTKYLKMKEKEMELKKKAIDVRENEMQVKKHVASEKLKFNENKHKDWLNVEKLKCELLKKLLKNQNDGEKSD